MSRMQSEIDKANTYADKTLNPELQSMLQQNTIDKFQKESQALTEKS